jgi:hypothetical protein
MEVMGQFHAPAALPSAKHPMDRRLGDPTDILDAAEKGKTNYTCWKSNPNCSFVQPPAHSPTAIPTEIFQILTVIKQKQMSEILY